MDTKTALKLAQNICARKEQCKLDLSLKLKNWGLSEIEKGEVLDSLQKEGFIDENRYAETYCREKFRFNRWGKINLAYMLKQKQIPGNIIDNALALIDRDEYKEILTNELMKKATFFHGINQVNKKKKLLQFALQRGFEYEIIMAVINEMHHL